MDSSSDPPRKPNGGGGGGDEDDQSDRKPPPVADSETPVDRSSALKCHRMRYEDAVDPNAERVASAEPHDVILGRGKRVQDLEGNVRMRRIVQKYSTRYHSLRPSEKKSLIQMVYREIVQDGARFLIKGPDGEDTYLVVDEEIALQKVSNIMRRKKPIVEQPVVSIQIGEGPSLDPGIQQGMISATRNHVVGTINPAVVSLNQQMALRNEVARLPTNPLLSSLDSLASLSYASMHQLPNLPTNPTEQVRMIMTANMIERDRMLRDALTIQQLNAMQESRASAVYAQALNRNALYPLLASTDAPLLHLQSQSHPNNEDENDEVRGEGG